MSFLVFLTAAYFLGSIPFGLITGRLVKRVDIREHGSKSIGATNVFRVVGKGWGIAVMFLDALKGYAAIFLPRLLTAQRPDLNILLLLGIAAICGHTFSCWIGFKGGKGVATSLGVFLAICPLPTLITFALWGAVFAVTHIISVSSLAASVAFPWVLIFTLDHEPGRGWLILTGFLLMGFIFYTHRANLQRLVKKQEKPLF